MSTLTELRIWLKWLQNYQSYEGKFSVPIAYELARVLGHAESDICNLQAEVDILLERERRREDAEG